MRLSLILTLVGLLLSGCASTYYAGLERLGIPKRDVLVKRVEVARDSQVEAKKEFSDALDAFKSLTQVQPGEIETVYKDLRNRLSDCEARAKEVRSRIAGIQRVSDALFREWSEDAAKITSREDRAESERLLAETRKRSDAVILTMSAAASRMDPILEKLRDKVLLLKANLNAQAVAGLQGTAQGLETDVTRLIGDMERAILEADLFLRSNR